MDPNIFLSGSDDTFAFYNDARLPINKPPPLVYIGHNEGITHVELKPNSCFYFITNSKDQSIKLWDIRCGSNYSITHHPMTTRITGFDYRRDYYPHNANIKRSPNDTSILTMKGHTVLRTLIKCHFSPQVQTNQQFIYTGSANGAFCVYDGFTGQLVCRRPNIDKSIMRDVQWHEDLPLIVSSSFSGEISMWNWRDLDRKSMVISDEELNEVDEL